MYDPCRLKLRPVSLTGRYTIATLYTNRNRFHH
jgi:hypothetical protein